MSTDASNLEYHRKYREDFTQSDLNGPEILDLYLTLYLIISALLSRVIKLVLT